MTDPTLAERSPQTLHDIMRGGSFGLVDDEETVLQLILQKEEGRGRTRFK